MSYGTSRLDDLRRRASITRLDSSPIGNLSALDVLDRQPGRTFRTSSLALPPDRVFLDLLISAQAPPIPVRPPAVPERSKIGPPPPISSSHFSSGPGPGISYPKQLPTPMLQQNHPYHSQHQKALQPPLPPPHITSHSRTQQTLKHMNDHPQMQSKQKPLKPKILPTIPPQSHPIHQSQAIQSNKAIGTMKLPYTQSQMMESHKQLLSHQTQMKQPQVPNQMTQTLGKQSLNMQQPPVLQQAPVLQQPPIQHAQINNKQLQSQHSQIHHKQLQNQHTQIQTKQLQNQSQIQTKQLQNQSQIQNKQLQNQHSQMHSKQISNQHSSPVHNKQQTNQHSKINQHSNLPAQQTPTHAAQQTNKPTVQSQQAQNQQQNFISQSKIDQQSFNNACNNKVSVRQDSNVSSDSFSQNSSPSYTTKTMETPLLPQNGISSISSSNQYQKVSGGGNKKINGSHGDTGNGTVIARNDVNGNGNAALTKSISTPASLQTIIIRDMRRPSAHYVTRGRLRFRFAQVLVNAVALLAIAGGLAAYFRGKSSLFLSLSSDFLQFSIRQNSSSQ
ncbi:hypothetical protein C0J52_17036 [Blattella germanica]|nr:hypothetical protein C0J52_17036 [Blattella germanica]